MLAILPRPFRNLLFENHDNLNALANEVFESLALLMPDSQQLVAARRVLLMLGPKPSGFDFKPLEELHAELGEISPGFAALLENSLESGDLFVESPIRIDAYSPALQERLKPLQDAADQLNQFERLRPQDSARIVLSCMKAMYPAANIGAWLKARGCQDEVVRSF